MYDTINWYATIIKPFFAPPAAVFAPVWTVLYIIIVITFVRVFYLTITKVPPYKKPLPFQVALPFILNLLFNFLYSPIQFALQNNYLATLDILLVLGTLIWAMAAIWPYSRRIAFWQIPYLLWVIFATVLQLSITWLNL